MFITWSRRFDSCFRTQGGMMEKNFEETYMSLTKKELVKRLKTKIKQTQHYLNLWKEEQKSNEYLTKLLDELEK